MVAVKRRVETGHLRQFRMTLAERLDQFDLAGQMIRVVWPDAMQFIQQFLRDQLGRGVLHAVDHAVSHRLTDSKSVLLFEPINQEIRRRFVIGGGEIAAALLIRGRVIERQIRPAQSRCGQPFHKALASAVRQLW